MQKTDQERVVSFKNIIHSNEKLSFLESCSEEELLDILNASIIPNSISKNILHFTLFFNFIFHGKREIEKIFSKMSILTQVFSKTGKDIVKVGYFYGFDSQNAEYHFHRYLKLNADISKGELEYRKRVPFREFIEYFYFVQTILSRGVKNGRFPRF